MDKQIQPPDISNITQYALDIVSRYWKVILVVFIFVIGYMIFSRYSFIYLNVSSPLSSDEKFSIAATTPFEDINSTGAGLKILPKDVISITVSHGSHLSTSAYIEVPFYRFTKIDIDLKFSKNASAIAYENISKTDCATYNSHLSKLLSYNCHEPKTIQSYNRESSGMWLNETIAKSNGTANLNKTNSYNGGILTINPNVNYSSHNAILFYPGDSNNKYLEFSQPDNLTKEDMITSAIATDRQNPSNRNFVVMGSNKIAYFAKFSDDTVSYYKITPPDNLDEWHDKPACNLTLKKVVCYYTTRAVGDHQGVTPPTEYFSIYDIASGETSTKRLSDKLHLNRLYVTSDGGIYGRTYRDIYHFKEHSNRFTNEKIDSTVMAAGASDALYYIKRGGVYKYDKTLKQSNLIFYSDHITPTSIIAHEKTYIQGTVNNDPRLVAYELLDEDYIVDKPRSIDILPIPTPKSAPTAFSQQLVGDQLNIFMHLPRPFPGSANSMRDSYIKTRDYIDKTMRDADVDIEKLEITYTY